MSMTSKKAYAVGMEPFPDGIYRVRFPYYYRNPEGMPEEGACEYYLQSIKDVFEECAPADTIAAIAVEPLQGEVGSIPTPVEWMKDAGTKEPAPKLTSALIQECPQNGLMIENAGTYGNVIRFLAPLVMTDEQLEAGLQIMEKVLVKCMEKLK